MNTVSIPIEQVNAGRWALIQRALLRLQGSISEKINIEKLNFKEENNFLHISVMF